MDVRALIQRNQDRMNALYASQDQTARYESLAEAFRTHFGGEPELFVSAPGRTEVVGNHTDHNNGRVLAASVNLDTVAAIAPRADGVIELYSEGYDHPFTVDTADLSVRENEKETTFALIRGVAARLAELGYKIGGFNASVTSTVFKGSGLSSSAAFEVMLVAAFDALYNGWTIDPKLNARISQYAENMYLRKAKRFARSVGECGRRAGHDGLRGFAGSGRSDRLRLRCKGLFRLRRKRGRRARQPYERIRGDSR